MADFEGKLIDVPYNSQWDSDAKLSRGDCGVVALAMIARWLGKNVTPDGIIRGAGLPIGAHAYSFEQLLTAASYCGIKMYVEPVATWPVIQNAIALGDPVITLLRYGEISNNQDDFDGSHFWVVVGFDDEYVYVNDPDWWEPRRIEGKARAIPLWEFKQAIGSALSATGNQPYQSLFVL